jgi:raffinose/stachyose/melibiose transport system substrate-binding protein
LTDLTPVAEEQGWTDRVSDATMSIGKVNPETRLSGVDGNLYGVPIAGEFVWLFYNQDMLDAAGLSVPTTFDELEAAFATFVEQGVTPISLGAGDYPTVHFMYTLSLVQATPGWVADY